MGTKAFENILGKGENQLFLLFQLCFLPYQREKSPFYQQFILSSANGLNLVQSQILLFDDREVCMLDLSNMKAVADDKPSTG